MGTGLRVVFVGALAALLLTTFGFGWMSGYILNNASDQRHQSYRYASDKPLEIDPAAPRRASSKPFEYRSPCDDPKGQAESDLCAQWKAANAAENSAFWTKWGFWIGVIGSALLLWQIILTREAVEDTSQATKAMERQNEIAEDTAKRQLRAYVDVTKMGIIGMEPGIRPLLKAQLNNHGVTPARDFEILAAPFFFPAGSPARPIRFDKRMGQGSRMVLAPGYPLTHTYEFRLPFNEHQVEMVTSGQWQLIYVIVLRYRDVFGHRHWSIAKSEFDPAQKMTDDGVWPFSVCSDGNRSS